MPSLPVQPPLRRGGGTKKHGMLRSAIVPAAEAQNHLPAMPGKTHIFRGRMAPDDPVHRHALCMLPRVNSAS
uniref:Uncharacterized protein n=1 Tax=Paracidobacterium acidisoli TaxID=2303751 RepID=A0A372IUN5_9BACT